MHDDIEVSLLFHVPSGLYCLEQASQKLKKKLNVQRGVAVMRDGKHNALQHYT